MFKKQKNVIIILSHFLVFLLIQGLLVCPGFAFNNDISSPEHLSPRISISNSAFFDLIKKSFANTAKEISEIPEKVTLNFLDKQYQEKQRIVLQNEIIDSFKQNHPKNQEQVNLIKTFFNIAQEHYQDNQFESGEFYYNHALEVASFAAKNDAGFIEILVAIFHRMPTNMINPVIESLGKEIGKNKSEAFRKNELREINRLIKKFLKIVELKYKVNSQPANSIENFMGAVINLAEGDFRIIRVVLADKQASIAHASEMAKEDIVEEIQDIYGPLAGRFGLFEIKKELENSMFKIHNPQGCDMVMRKVRNTFGVDYSEINDSLDKTKALIQKIANDNQIDAVITARVKSLYRIYVKEKIAGKGKGKKDTLFGVDTLGIKVVCETAACFEWMLNETQQALKAKNLGNWKIGKIKTISSGIVYLNLEEIEGQGSLEVQFLTKEADNLREINFAHWSYEISRQTGRKQKFDKVEDFEFFELREMYQAAIDDPERKDVNINTVIEEYFKIVCEHNKQWVYVFEKSLEVINGKEVDVVKPKRLSRGANGPVFASQTGIDLFNENYDGIIFYEWRGTKLMPKSNQNQIKNTKMQKNSDLDPLNDGDIIEVKTSMEGLFIKLEENKMYKANLSSSIRGFLRPRILLAQLGLSLADKSRYDKNAQSFLTAAFKQKGVIFGSSIDSKFPQSAKYMQNFLKEFAATKKLKNSEELMMALALQLIDSSEIVAWAAERGAAALENKLPIDDKGIQAQLRKIYGSLEQVFIEVGIGKIRADKVFEELKNKQKVNMSISPTISGDYSGQFEYNIEIEEMNKKAMAAKKRKIRAQIIEILRSQGIDFGEDSFNERKSQKKKGGFIINFEIPVRYEQLPNIREALLSKLESIVKLKTKREKERDKALKNAQVFQTKKIKEALQHQQIPVSKSVDLIESAI